MSMLWFQYWGQNIPSFTEFRLFYKKKTVRVVNKSSYQETFFKLKLIIKSLFQNWLQNAILLQILDHLGEPIFRKMGTIQMFALGGQRG